WVYTYLRYPEIPLREGISGTVTVEFIVEKDGSVTNVRAVRGNDQYLEDEAVRVISVSPKWKPGLLGGQKVRVKYSVPVEFRLKKR
ncbi:MAG TPA: energy transducer TonB, partial [Candidatus Coprenecus stercorigallinarum]|nr:energy transducer TonB [Candidatus Coprenecus stercorigallinarum]